MKLFTVAAAALPLVATAYAAPPFNLPTSGPLSQLLPKPSGSSLPFQEVDLNHGFEWKHPSHTTHHRPTATATKRPKLSNKKRSKSKKEDGEKKHSHSHPTHTSKPTGKKHPKPTGRKPSAPKSTGKKHAHPKTTEAPESA